MLAGAFGRGEHEHDHHFVVDANLSCSRLCELLLEVLVEYSVLIYVDFKLYSHDFGILDLLPIVDALGLHRTVNAQVI